MVFPCRNETCSKQFSTKFSRNKHERIKVHFHEKKGSHKIPFDETKQLYTCPTENCTTSSKYKPNITKHLKSCNVVNNNKNAARDNKTCNICNKTFLKKSNRDRHIKNVREAQSPSTDKDDTADDILLPSMAFDDIILPSMASAITEMVASTSSPLPETAPPTSLPLPSLPATAPPTSLPLPSLPATAPPTSIPLPSLPETSSLSSPSEIDTFSAEHPTRTSSITTPRTTPKIPSSKTSRLESVIKKIVTNVDFETRFSTYVIEYLQQQLKENPRQAVIYMRECFGTLFEDDFFLNWLANSVGYKPYSLKNLITVKTSISRKKLPCETSGSI